jgi:hypothetical protein
MNSEDARGSRSGLSAAAGVVAMLAVVAIVLGAGFLLTRQLLQAGVSSTITEASSPDRLRGRSEPQAAATPTAPVEKSGSTASSESAETPGVVPIRISVRDEQQPSGRRDRDIRVGEPRTDSSARLALYHRSRERASEAVERTRHKRGQYVAARLRRQFRKWRNPVEPDDSTLGRPALDRDARWGAHHGRPGGCGLSRS